MKQILVHLLVLIAFMAIMFSNARVQAADDEFEEGSVHANRFLKRTFFHPGATKCEEQKREAREDYEERCEPSFPLFRNTGTRRFCPDIHDWKEFDNYEIGNGFEGRDPLINDDETSTKRNPYFTTKKNNDRYRRPPTTTAPTVDDEDHAENPY